MNINHNSIFKECYIMQYEDIERFAATLADGFSQYSLYKYFCAGEYDHDKISLFWTVSLKLVFDNSICIADSKEANSVLVYIRPKSKEPSFVDYIKAGGLKMLHKIGLRSVIRMLRFDAEAQKIALHHKTDNDGYLMGFATRIDKQRQHYGKPLLKALLNYLDASGEGCYLETMKAENVELYQRFSFQLKEHVITRSGDLTLFAMIRPGNQLN